jgi:hypothetical protein
LGEDVSMLINHTRSYLGTADVNANGVHNLSLM